MVVVTMEWLGALGRVVVRWFEGFLGEELLLVRTIELGELRV
jgi:hypothetical protein